MSGVESRTLVGLDQETSRRNFLKTAAWTGAALSAMGIGGFGVAVSRDEA
jgi:nitrous oxide reductase